MKRKTRKILAAVYTAGVAALAVGTALAPPVNDPASVWGTIVALLLVGISTYLD